MADVGIIMGSDSDLPVMQDAAKILEDFGVDYEISIVSAHRTPKKMYEYAETAADRGLKVIIAGAGGAAHLPGMTAAISTLPVIGVPIKTRRLFPAFHPEIVLLARSRARGRFRQGMCGRDAPQAHERP